MVSDGELADRIWAVVHTLVATKVHQARGAGAAETLQPLITQTITKVIKQTIETELKEQTMKSDPKPTADTPTWAHRAAAGLPQPPARGNSFNLKPVPPRLSREVVIRCNEISEDMRKRNPMEMVQAVNLALRTDAAKAARRLPSGDVVITFNTDWVQTAFGDKVALTPRILYCGQRGRKRAYTGL